MFGKKDGKSIDNTKIEITRANQKLMTLETRLRGIVRTEVNTLKESKRRKRENPRCVARLKNAYYALQLVNIAMERMEDIENSYELTTTMGELSRAMKLVNSLEGKTDMGMFASLFLRYRTKKLQSNAEAASEGGMKEYFKEDINDLVDDSILEALVDGKALDEVLYEDSNTFGAADDLLKFCDEYSKDFDSAGFGNTVSYEESMRDFESYIDKL